MMMMMDEVSFRSTSDSGSGLVMVDSNFPIELSVELQPPIHVHTSTINTKHQPTIEDRQSYICNLYAQSNKNRQRW